MEKLLAKSLIQAKIKAKKPINLHLSVNIGMSKQVSLVAELSYVGCCREKPGKQ